MMFHVLSTPWQLRLKSSDNSLTHSWYWLLVSWAGLSVRQAHVPPTCSMGPWQLGAWVPEGAAVGNVSERPRETHDVTQDVQDITPPPCALQATYWITSTLHPREGKSDPAFNVKGNMGTRGGKGPVVASAGECLLNSFPCVQLDPREFSLAALLS